MRNDFKLAFEHDGLYYQAEYGLLTVKDKDGKEVLSVGNAFTNGLIPAKEDIIRAVGLLTMNYEAIYNDEECE